LQHQHHRNFTTLHALSHTQTHGHRDTHTYAKRGVGRDFGVCPDAVIFEAQARAFRTDFLRLRDPH